jgi:hypothetical protein
LIYATVIAEQPSKSSSFVGTKYSNDPNASGGQSDNKNIKKIGPPASFNFEQRPTPPALTDEQGEEIV